MHAEIQLHMHEMSHAVGTHKLEFNLLFVEDT